MRSLDSHFLHETFQRRVLFQSHQKQETKLAYRVVPKDDSHQGTVFVSQRAVHKWTGTVPYQVPHPTVHEAIHTGITPKALAGLMTSFASPGWPAPICILLSHVCKIPSWFWQQAVFILLVRTSPREYNERRKIMLLLNSEFSYIFKYVSPWDTSSAYSQDSLNLY